MFGKFRWKRLLLAITVIVLISLLIYLWDFYYEVSSPLLTSIIAGLVIVIATVFGVDRVLAYRENLKWKRAKARVLLEISTCLNGMLTNVRGLARIDVSVLGLPGVGGMTSDEWVKHSSRNLTGFFKNKSNRSLIADAVRQRDQKSWDSFFTGAQSCVQELERLVSMFPSITSQPELVEKITKVRSDIRRLFSIRMIFPDVLGIPLEQQPTPRDGDKKSLSKAIHEGAISSLDNLIMSIISAKETVDKMLEESA